MIHDQYHNTMTFHQLISFKNNGFFIINHHSGMIHTDKNNGSREKYIDRTFQSEYHLPNLHWAKSHRQFH